MYGRVLFAVVWLIIAAGVALPLYPRDHPKAIIGVTTGPLQLVAGTNAFGCEDCPVADTAGSNCRTDCPCDKAVPAVFVPLEGPVSITITVTERVLPPRLPQSQPLPVKLPAI